MEKPGPSPEKLIEVNQAIAVCSVDQLRSPQRALDLSAQVSAMVDEYLSLHPSEMLPKTPQEILDQFKSGNSLMLVSPGENGRVLFHATYYSVFENGEHKVLGAQVGEIGTVITHPDYRNLGLGSRGVRGLVSQLEQRWGNLIWLATNKQIDAIKAMSHGGHMAPIDFYQHPHLSYLTCTCQGVSERLGCPACPYRRRSAEASESVFRQVLEGNSVGKMPCTLIVSDVNKAAVFESVCRDVSREMGFPPIPGGTIDVASMKQIGQFFNKINTHT